MKNIVKEKPTDLLSGRTLYSTGFIDNEDVVDKTILDIGCGYGWLEINLSQRGAKKIIGTEINEENLVTAKNCIFNKSILFDTASAIKLPYENNCFDTVISFEVIEHIPKNSEEKMFKEVYRVLKNNGMFYLSTPNDNIFSKISDPAWILIGHRHYKCNDLIKLGKQCGFKIKNIAIKGRWWDIISINDLYISKWFFHRRPFFERYINKKNDNDYKNKEGFCTIFLCYQKI